MAKQLGSIRCYTYLNQWWAVKYFSEIKGHIRMQFNGLQRHSCANFGGLLLLLIVLVNPDLPEVNVLYGFKLCISIQH